MQFFQLITLLVADVASTAARPEHEVKESHPVPASFLRESDAPADSVVRLQLMLKQHRFEELEQHLLEISDPDHHRYGQHLNIDHINELVKPRDDASLQVHKWLAHKGIDLDAVERNAAGDVLSFNVPVHQAERLLDTKFGLYRHVEEGTRLMRAPEWKLPRHLHQHVTTIQPTTSFLRRGPHAHTLSSGDDETASEASELSETAARQEGRAVEPACNISAITPTCLRILYGTIGYTPQVPGKNRLGLTNFRNQVNNRSDIGIFLEKYRPEAAAAADEFGLISVNGGTLQQTQLNETQLRIGLGGEGDLDVETLIGLAWPTPLASWSVAGAPPFIPDADSKNYTEIEPYMTWLDYILQQDTIPQVISNSYADDEQTVPPAYAQAVCSKFAQLAARGVSFFTGSGDGGVGGTMPNGSCLSNNDNSTRQFVPQFPSTCPYVTSVGGTTELKPEVAAYDLKNGFASGGGFSNYFSQPKYQANAVDNYLVNTVGKEFEGLYNASGRAYPDISAYSTKYTTIWNGTQRIVDGTSAATPAMAAVISLVNDALIAAGKPALGWLNPWLYKRGKHAFEDIVSGSATGCNTTGFLAAEGWDPVTGWGTPRFERLLQAAGLDTSSCAGFH